MACHCHGKNGESVKRTLPTDQCSMCAKKHIVKAWCLFHEFTYEDDNRDMISGQLRNAADHLMFDHRETALLARNLAVIIEENRDKEITGEWKELLQAVREDFNNDNPEIAERLENLRKSQIF